MPLRSVTATFLPTHEVLHGLYSAFTGHVKIRERWFIDVLWHLRTTSDVENFLQLMTPPSRLRYFSVGTKKQATGYPSRHWALSYIKACQSQMRHISKHNCEGYSARTGLKTVHLKVREYFFFFVEHSQKNRMQVSHRIYVELGTFILFHIHFLVTLHFCAS